MINEVRRDGSFIYEEFVETQGTDVKMYTVGPDYGEQVKWPRRLLILPVHWPFSYANYD